MTAMGTAHDFEWYDEKWKSGDFSLRYRPKSVELKRANLLKRQGGLEVRALSEEKRTELRFLSHGLRLEDVSHLGQAPLEGEILGNVELTQSDGVWIATGFTSFVRTAFRGQSLPASELRVQSDGQEVEILGNLFGEKLRGRIVRKENKLNWNALLYFTQFDVVPLLSIWMQKDLPTLSEVSATGDISLEGNWEERGSLHGNATISSLSIGLKGTPLKNVSPLILSMRNGVIKVSRCNLVGTDGEITFGGIFGPGQVEASLDGRLDLQYLQPFISGLDYGTGKVSVGLRVGGTSVLPNLLGNVSLEEGTFRIKGMEDDFRSAQIRLTVSRERVNVDQFLAVVNGGKVDVSGQVHVKNFERVSPDLKISVSKVALHTQGILTTRLSGEFSLIGNEFPYLLKGKCRVLEAKLTKFELAEPSVKDTGPPVLSYEIDCDANDKLFVATDTIDAEFKGSIGLRGTSQLVGLTGSAEALRGSILFREKRFNLNSGTVKFESPAKIAPRFSVSGLAFVKESKAVQPQEYEVTLMASGTPSEYKIRLSSNPALEENDIISLLILGVTGKAEGGGNYVDLGTTLVGSIPIQSKIQDELGVNIKINTQAGGSSARQLPQTTPGTVGSTGDITVPVVQIQKEISRKTKVSYSSTLEDKPVREFKLEQRLGDRLTGNFSVVDGSRGGDAGSVQSYGLDFRYRFQFE